jgi:hypothetical protein
MRCMLRLPTTILQVLIITLPGIAVAGDIEIGATGGFGFYQDATITNAVGSARAGFGPRFVLGGVVGWDWRQHFAIEGRYIYQDGDAALRSQGTEANLDGDAQLVLGELIFSPQPKRSRFRFFGAVGGGIKVYQAGPLSSNVQPLTDFATLQKANQAEPLISFGGGIKYALSERWLVRVEFREYTTTFPTRVITPSAGARLHGWMDDIVPTLGISRTF